MKFLVGATGFEPATSCSRKGSDAVLTIQNLRSARLAMPRHAIGIDYSGYEVATFIL